MSKNATICVRIDKSLKKEVEGILGSMGMNTSQVVSTLFHQIKMEQSLPFHPHIPNKETRRAIDEARHPENLDSYNSVDEMFEDAKSWPDD